MRAREIEQVDLHSAVSKLMQDNICSCKFPAMQESCCLIDIHAILIMLTSAKNVFNLYGAGLNTFIVQLYKSRLYSDLLNVILHMIFCL